jgi:hypothetical protein
MKLTKLTQVVIKMPDMPPEVMQGMSQDELMEAQEIGDDQPVYINPDFVLAVYPNGRRWSSAYPSSTSANAASNCREGRFG